MSKKTKKQYTEAIKLGINNVADIGLEFETSGLFDSNEYDKYNLSDAMLALSHIAGSIGTEYNLNRHTSDEALELSTKFGQGLRQLILDYTGIDSFKIYK